MEWKVVICDVICNSAKCATFSYNLISCVLIGKLSKHALSKQVLHSSEFCGQSFILIGQG